MKPDGRSEKQKELETHDKAITGGIQEEVVYANLRECLEKTEVKNTVLINGWKDNGNKERTQKEFDFLIISQPSQTIIHIEVKKTCSESQLKSATKQLHNGLQMFQATIPFPRSQNCKYARVIYFGLAEKGKESGGYSLNFIKETSFENQCGKCKNFIIGPNTDLNLWWNELTKCVSLETKEWLHAKTDDTYQNVLSFLLHQMYKQQDCATTGQLVQLTSQTSDKICNPDTILFWSKEQYKTLKDLKETKVALTSGFGTGKTILIRAKAKELIASGQKVVLVIFEITAEKTILRMEYEKLFQTGNSLIAITSLSGAKGNYV
jgi:hypothetical protein